MTATVTLRQEKTILTDSYRVVSTIISASPTGMYPLFVIQEGVDAYNEVYQRVATLDDLALYTENPLITIVAGTPGDFIALTPGQTIEITNALTVAPQWFDTYFVTALFEIATVDAAGNWLTVTSVKPFPTAASGLAWAKTGGGPSGIGAKTRRADTSPTTYLRRHWTSLLGTVRQAESRFTAIEAYVESVVDLANVHGVTFVGIETVVYP